MTRYISDNEFPAFLRRHVTGKQNELAERLGVSAGYLSMLLSGQKRPSRNILGKLGLVRETRYLVRERPKVVSVHYELPGEAA
jgi:transcriptional regulator with XRE-family HTH domain